MKNCNLLTVFVISAMLSGCAIPTKELRTEKVVFAKEVIQVPGNFAPKDITEVFSIDDPFVNVFVTIDWDKKGGAGVKNVKWEWITKGKVEQEVKVPFNFYDSPFYLTGNIKTELLGKGKHSVKLYIDKILFVEKDFEIK